MTTEEKQELAEKTKACTICEKEFKEEDIKCFDHCHFTGNARGYTHQDCNLHFHILRSKIPLLFHNLKGYDGHFIIKELGDYIKNNINQDSISDIKCIATNQEKMMSIDWRYIRFLDSIQFMAMKLEDLAKNLTEE